VKSKLIILAIVGMMFTSCKEKPLNIEATKVYGFSMASKNFQKYELKKSENDSILKFHYQHQKSNQGDLVIDYNKNEDQIVTQFGKFLKENYSYTYRGYEFVFYNTKLKGAKNSTILFNKDYGVLATQTSRVSFLFLKDSLSAGKNKEIFDNISNSLK